MKSKKNNIIIVFIILIIAAGFHLVTIREGHIWEGDFAMYVHHAKNIVEGSDYKDTGYIYNPLYPSLGPKTYPPVFPLLLAPIYKWFGLNLTVMKIEIVLIFVASLLVIFFVFKKRLPFHYSVAMIALIGFNPWLCSFKNNVRSDIPFVFFLYLSLFFVDKAYQRAKSQRYQLLYAILVGIFIYLSYGTRTLGALLIPSLLIYEIIRFKKLTRVVVIATGVVVVLSVAQNLFLHNESSYFDQYIFNPEMIIYNLLSYVKSVAALCDNGYSRVFQGILFLIISELALIGYIIKIKDKITIGEVFFFLYVTTLIIWPANQGMRFFIPVVPFGLFYTFVGINAIKRITFLSSRKMESTVFVVLVGAMFISYFGKYTKMDYGPIQDGVTKKESIEVFNYIREKTTDRDIFVFMRPRILSLFTGRSASVYFIQEYKAFWNYLSNINATYIVVNRFFDPDMKFLYPFVKMHKDNFQEVYSNPDFRVYMIINK